MECLCCSHVPIGHTDHSIERCDLLLLVLYMYTAQGNLVGPGLG